MYCNDSYTVVTFMDGRIRIPKDSVKHSIDKIRNVSIVYTSPHMLVVICAPIAASDVKLKTIRWRPW